MPYCNTDRTATPAGFDLLVREMPYRDPLTAFSPWAEAPLAALLHSAAPAGGRGRYSYIAVEPFCSIEANEGATVIDGQPVAGTPFDALQRTLATFTLSPHAAPVPFAGGAVGFFGYELGRTLERLPGRHGNDLAIPDMVFGLYDIVLAFDHAEHRAWLLSSGFPERTPVARRARATQRAADIEARLAQAPATLPEPPRAMARWHAELSREAYMARVARILDYLRAGDILQANFTGRMLAPRPDHVSAFDLFRRLTALSPAPFAAYLACGPRLSIASASPERLLSLDAEGHIETRPIKGTRPRGATAEQDAALAAELRTSLKDRAENVMITDLLRNDIGRVARIGSVRVPALCQVETFASVHHLVSVIEGQLRQELGPLDLLRATFPGGSITGAPKIHAMEIIDELEAARRGPYCGAIAWIGFDGAMDSSIVIRTLTLTPEQIVAQAGGGIVADSDPGREHDEMMVKIGPLLRVLEEEK